MKPADAAVLAGTVLTPQGWVRGWVRIECGRIAAVEGDQVERPGPGEALLLPGFIDLHVHGGGGRDVMEGGDACGAVARLHARHGTTAWLATTMTAPMPEVQQALEGVSHHCRASAGSGARCLGVHLEGPYLSPARLGAQPAHSRSASLEAVLDLHAIAPIRLLTLAPEEGEHLALIPALVAQGIRVQLGHSNADYETGRLALEQGAMGFTHLFNAMSPLHHRAPGLVGAALAHAQRAELIPDLLHVHPGAVRAALRAIPELYCVTDATAAAGMPDGEYRLGEQRVHKCLGGVRLADGTLAGSALTMDQALRNLVSIGMELEEASRRCSLYPARALGWTDRGALVQGAWADVLQLDAALQVQQVWVEGVRFDA